MSGRVKIPTTVPFLEGYNVKPIRTEIDGNVIFTNGTEEIIPNKEQCEAYGYTFNKQSGVCSAFIRNPNLELATENMSNIIKGQHNSTDVGTTNTHILGQLNTTGRESRNNILVGQNNKMSNSCQNSVILGDNNNVETTLNGGITLGTKANVTTSNSITIGANQPDDNLGERQTIILSYGCQTTGTDPSATAGGTVSSGINNKTATRFVLPDNAIIYFHADTIAVRTGGTAASGAVGDFYSAVERGVMINKSGTCTISRERDTIKTSGTVTNWRVNAGVGSGNTLALQCRGNNDMTIEWNITVTITMIQTSVSL
jgi:hypothetical protein